MKKDVLIIANYWHFEFEKQSSRYRTMAEVLCDNGFNVEVISSSFRHQTKKQRDTERIKAMIFRYKVTLLKEPAYRKNISLRRIWSHHMFAKEVVRYLATRKKPDAIIVSVPSLSVGSAVVNYANKNGIKVIVDIQDLWPEAFRMAINIPVVSDILFAPMMLQANRIYAKADKIMAVSKTYVSRAKSKNKKGADGLAVYIGTDSVLVKNAMKGYAVNKPENEFWIGYIGALGHSYDIKLIIDAIQILKIKGINNIVFKVMGEGVLLSDFKRYAVKNAVNCDFMGFVEYGEMMSTLKVCDVAVNPIVGNSVSSIINKVSDYAMAGVPVINTQNSQEYRELIEAYRCGINCESGNAKEVAEAVSQLYYETQLREEMAINAEKLASEKFDRMKTYGSISSFIC